MKKLLMMLLAAGLAAAAQAATLEETFEQSYDARAGASLVLSNTNGSIEIRSWDQPRIRVHAVKHVEADDASSARTAMHELRIDVTQRNGALHVVTKTPGHHGDRSFWDVITGSGLNTEVRYEVMVPRATTLDVDDTNGHIDVDGVNGALKIGTTNGKIQVVHCAGTLDASTTNGSIEGELLAVTAGQRVHAETTNGRIELTLPSKLSANLDASTSNGGVHCDLPVNAKRSSHTSLHGTLNGGGATDVSLETTNGSITIHAGK